MPWRLGVPWCSGAKDLVRGCCTGIARALPGVPWHLGALALVPWRLGLRALAPWLALVPWLLGARAPWLLGALAPLLLGAWAPCLIGSLAPWLLGSLASRCALVLWCQGLGARALRGCCMGVARALHGHCVVCHGALDLVP